MCHSGNLLTASLDVAQVAVSYAVMLLYIALALGYLPAGARPWALLVTGRLGETPRACMHAAQCFICWLQQQQLAVCDHEDIAA